MLTGDFLGMSLTTDNVRPSSTPNAWRIGTLTLAGMVMGLGELVLCAGVLIVGRQWLHLDIQALRTLAFLVIVFGNQATMYTNRERRRLWSSCPSRWVLASSICDILIAASLAIGGVAMSPLAPWVVLSTLGASAVFALLFDFVKFPVFRALQIT
jgi:H+-transporting ATPase